MKYHSIFISAITSLCFLSAPSSLAAVNSKTQSPKNERWFEIEVILFKHLANNQQNNESFNAKDPSSKKHAVIDLLTPYLQTDISSLKHLMPQCGQPSPVFPYNIKSNSLQIWPTDSDYGDILTSAELSITENNSLLRDSSVVHKKVIPTFNSNVGNSTAIKAIQDHKLIQYADVELPKYSQYLGFNKTTLCVIPDEFIKQHYSAEQLATFNPNTFHIDKLVTTINGREQWRADENDNIIWASNRPYLISKKSLRLKSIANRIKRSRSYASLLHLGWRQPGVSRKRATAMKLFAGENLNKKHQEALALQANKQNSRELSAILEQRYSNASSEANNDIIYSDELSVERSLYLQAKQQQLNYLFEEFAELNVLDTTIGKNADNDKELPNQEAINELVAQLSTDMNKQVIPLIDANNPQEQLTDISAPIQPWAVDGFFKVHLDHYLYINSELNIIDVAKDSEAQNKIRFKQARRVISGEIHYFDHPYIGMIVQIRRFDPTKPAALAVSQNKK